MIQFTVFGHPEPQGSTRAFIPKGWKRPIITTANPKMKPWRQQIAGAAFDLSTEPFDGPVSVTMRFFLARPASAPKKRWAPEVKPDADKLLRAVNDSLSGILFNDDAQIVELHVFKHYGLPERVEICVDRPTEAYMPPVKDAAETVLNLFEKG